MLPPDHGQLLQLFNNPAINLPSARWHLQAMRLTCREALHEATCSYVAFHPCLSAVPAAVQACLHPLGIRPHDQPLEIPEQQFEKIREETGDCKPGFPMEQPLVTRSSLRRDAGWLELR